MRVLLAHQPVKFPIRQDTKDNGIPLGMMYLSSALKQRNPDVEVMFRDYRLHGEATLEDDLNNANVVALGASTADYSDALRILHKAKALGKRTIMGGILPTLIAPQVLQSAAVDVVVRGEGELTFSELLRADDLSTVAGITYLDNGRLVENPKRPAMNDFPFPDFAMTDFEEYLGVSTAPVYTARGCPMRCSYCTLNKFWEYSHRVDDLDKVLEQVQRWADLGFDDVRFKDEDFPLRRKRTMQLLERLAEANFPVRYKAKSRVDRLTPELIDAFERAGFHKIYMGLEAFTPETLGRALKGYRRPFQDKLELALNSSIHIELGFILGLQGETPETLKYNVEMISKIGSRPDVTPRITFLTPYPGTKLAEDPEGLRILSSDWDRYNSVHPVAVPESLGPNAVELLVDAYEQIVEATGTRDYNPPINLDYLGNDVAIAAR